MSWGACIHLRPPLAQVARLAVKAPLVSGLECCHHLLPAHVGSQDHHVAAVAVVAAVVAAGAAAVVDAEPCSAVAADGLAVALAVAGVAVEQMALQCQPRPVGMQLLRREEC